MNNIAHRQQSKNRVSTIVRIDKMSIILYELTYYSIGNTKKFLPKVLYTISLIYCTVKMHTSVKKLIMPITKKKY